MKYLPMILGSLIILAFVALAIGCKVSVWKECRSTNSWVYCWSTLEK